MNKNVDDYKKAVDKIEASEKLKESTWTKVQNKKQTKSINLRQLVAVCATFVVIVIAGIAIFNNKDIIKDKINGDIQIAEADLSLPKYKDIDELKQALLNCSSSGGYDVKNAIVETAVEDAEFDGATSSTTGDTSSARSYSETNTQVKGVDEADIVKTDGKYIYYVCDGKLLIVDADSLELLATIKDESTIYGNIQEIFIKDNKVVVLGTIRVPRVIEDVEDPDVIIFGKEEVSEAVKRYNPSDTVFMSVAKVYDISKKSEPKLVRQVGLEGYYNTARMIDENVYLISNKYTYYYKNSTMKDNELLPMYLDTAESEEPRRVEVTDISHIENPQTSAFMMVAGFNINDKKPADIETVLGASDEVYASKDNLYVTDTVYNYGRFVSDHKTNIYKFKLKNGKLSFVAQGSVKGYVNDQFSMDEYDGYLRIATTGENIMGDDSNRLFVLDEKLEKVGELTGIAVGEQIKSVRFVGKVGYVVTFEQIDPLFVIDLSNPIDPKLRGELEIPGYSAYLHPYDETHIIGIGYNTKTNQWGGTSTSNLKMSMFDVSDLDNPKEIFNVDIGTGSSSSEIIYNHKALFYYKERNLIGFPVNTYSYGSSTGFVLYKIDLNNKEFKKYGELKNDSKYWNTVRRIIYIDDDIYCLTNSDITKYDINTAEQKEKLTIKTETPRYYYYNDIDIIE